MKINRKNIIALFICLNTLSNQTTLLCSEKEKNECVIIAVPGILAGDTKGGYSDKILNLIPPEYVVHKTGTIPLAHKPDMSQERCINYLDKAINPYKNNKLLFICTSQGSGTTTNYLAKINTDIPYENVKAVVCEGYPASFNQCLSHAIEQSVSFTELLPLKHFWFPYVIKYCPYFYKKLFPFIYYNPSKKQPFENLKHLPKDLPIIIVHCKQDKITPYEGAEIAYHQLITTGHNNTYLISVPQKTNDSLNITDTQHINVIKDESQQERDLKTILLALLHEKEIPHEIANRYQPDIESFKKRTDELQTKERLLKKCSLLFSTLKYFTFLYIIASKIKSSFFNNLSLTLTDIKNEKIFFQDLSFLL